MIIAAINKDKLFIKFDCIVDKATISLRDDLGFHKTMEVKRTEFEIIEIPIKSPYVFLEVKIDGERKIKKTVYHYE
jgi:hypothetical protein